MHRVFGKSIIWRNRVIHWNLVIALTMVAVVLIGGLVFSQMLYLNKQKIHTERIFTPTKL